jgi:hypothetical protein
MAESPDAVPGSRQVNERLIIGLAKEEFYPALWAPGPDADSKNHHRYRLTLNEYPIDRNKDFWDTISS